MVISLAIFAIPTISAPHSPIGILTLAAQAHLNDANAIPVFPSSKASASRLNPKDQWSCAPAARLKQGGGDRLGRPRGIKAEHADQ
jgi:hypothetical protein